MTALDVFRRNRPRSGSSWDDMSRDFDRLFNEMEQWFGGPSRTRFSDNQAEFFPACDVDEDESSYLMTLDIPGVDKNDIDIEVVGNTVKVSGERKFEHEDKSKNRYRMERQYGRFTRSFALPEGVNPNQIEANYDNGVLRISLPKSEQLKSHKISINSEKPGFIEKLTGKSKNQQTEQAS